MGKFKISLEFKLNIEGEREDVPEIVSNLQEQIGQALRPSARIVGGPVIDAQQPTSAPHIQEKKDSGRKSARPRSGERGQKTKAVSEGEKPKAHSWLHNAAEWGFPLQSWNVRDKSIWLLHVATSSANVKEMDSSEIANTFNALFRKAGILRSSNVSRDLGSARAAAPSLVSLDPGNNKFFLTTAGTAVAEQLCVAAKGQGATAST